MILKQCITVGLIFISVLDVQAKTVGYWRFEPGAVNSDSSGNGLDLTQIGTRISGISRPPRGPGSMLPTIPLTGMPNNGVAFLNGKGDQWFIADNALLDFSRTGFTFEAFISPVLSNGYTVVAIKAEEWRLTINEGNGILQFSLNNGSGNWESRSYIPKGINSFAAGKDYYVGVSVTPNGFVTYYYQDLSEGRLFSSTTAMNTSVTNLSNDLFFNGDAAKKALLYMDEVRLSSGVLSTLDLLPVKRGVVTDFRVDGMDASSIDLTWSNLDGTVVLKSSVTSLPLIDPCQNSFEANEGISGCIRLNLLAVDDGESGFNPLTWSGGGQSAGNSIATRARDGWGVRRDGKTNGDIQESEALILTCDLDNLFLGADQTLVLSGIAFFNDSEEYNGDVWMRNHEVPAGEPGAGVMLANNVRAFSDAIPIRDGDQIALMRGSANVRLGKLKFDILPKGFNIRISLLRLIPKT